MLYYLILTKNDTLQLLVYFFYRIHLPFSIYDRSRGLVSMHSWRMHFVSTVSDVSNSGIQYSSYSKSVEIIDNPENRAPITRIQPRHENIIGCVVSEITATSFAFTPRGTFFGSGFQSAAALHTHNPRPPRFLFIDSGQINENETTSRVIHNEAPGNFHYRVWYNCNSISMNDRSKK